MKTKGHTEAAIAFGGLAAIVIWLFASGVWTRYAPIWREYILWLGDPRLVIGMVIGAVVAAAVAIVVVKEINESPYR